MKILCEIYQIWDGNNNQGKFVPIEKPKKYFILGFTSDGERAILETMENLLTTAPIDCIRIYYQERRTTRR